jgi:hypothetical protein
MHLHKFSWNEYFSGTAATTLSGKYSSRQNPTVSSVHVLNCLFDSFTSGSTGGALYCTSATSFLVEFSSFFSCKTSSSQGGAIYFENSGAQSVLYGVCGYDCCSTYTSGSSNYQFAYISVNDGISNKNNFNYSSISRCVNVNSNSYFTLRLFNGKICCPSVNLSMSKCQYYSGITFNPFKDSSSFTSSLLYSTFADNNAFGHICIFFDRTGSKYEMKYCNIIRNTQGSSTNGIIHVWGDSMITDSCILENIATNIFWAYSSYTITLSNCTVDKIANNGYLSTQNTVTKSFILGLNHMSTGDCFAEYDSVGYLTAIPYVSSSTKKDSCYCCTNKINYYQARISDFFSLNWVFMFTFIHPNPFTLKFS